MQKKPLKLDKRRIKAFRETLSVLSVSIKQKQEFLLEYGEIYRFPKALMDKNKRRYKQILKAIETLQNNSFI